MTGLRTRPARDERGLTVAELLVASAILVMLLPLMGMLLRSAVTTQRDVQSVTSAGTAAQAAATSLELGVRNASQVLLAGEPTVAYPDEYLNVTTSSRTDPYVRVCQAWFYRAASETLYTKRVPADAGARLGLAVPRTAEDLRSWTVLVAPVVGRPSDPTSPGGPRRPLFTHTLTPSSGAGTVTVDLRVPTVRREPGKPLTHDAVVLSTAVTTRPQAEIASEPCF